MQLSILKSSLSLLFILLISKSSFAQELNAQVSVNAQKIATVDQKVFRNFETAVTEFLNNKKWTEESFAPEEKIECSFFITLDKQVDQGIYEATVTIQSSRPVFNSSYNSPVYSFIDNNWKFEYQEFQPIEYADNQFISNLSSMLAYYAYLLIGLDYDCFQLNGGDKYLAKCQEVLATVPSNIDASGWRPFDGSRNRYWIITDLINNRFAKFRSALYDYHMKGLDVFYDKPEQARTAILSALKQLDVVNTENPNSVLINMLATSKSEEWISIFSAALPNEKRQAYTTLIKLDPTNANKYNAIK